MAKVLKFVRRPIEAGDKTLILSVDPLDEYEVGFETDSGAIVERPYISIRLCGVDELLCPNDGALWGMRKILAD